MKFIVSFNFLGESNGFDHETGSSWLTQELGDVGELRSEPQSRPFPGWLPSVLTRKPSWLLDLLQYPIGVPSSHRHVDKDRAYFKRREETLKQQRFDTPSTSALLAAKQATLASYLIAQRIAREMKPHTIGEELVKPAATDVVRLMCGDDAAKKIETVALSNNTVRSRIVDMSLNIKDEVVKRMKAAGKYSYQLDDSTDVGNNAQLMVFVRYEGSVDLEVEFLFCSPMGTTTTGTGIFATIDKFQKEEGLSWEDCVSLCTDGAPAMTGVHRGFTALVKQLNPSVGIFHCLLHRENLAAKHLSPDLSSVMQEVVFIVNFIKGSAWLSRGKVLRRLVDLRIEVHIFLNEKKHQLAIRFHEKPWMLKVCYLNDLFMSVNELNTSMQGRDQNIIVLSEKISAFKEKLQLWQQFSRSPRNQYKFRRRE
ncbi:zinc finger BED domain-containing protein 5-like [Oratosquilla oratoria]|uniref:zinc finger BED domain-containing protein 5-like n=1 Tax=Oratosquilla oratoria TaxID=337810 RepID=UPI003F76FE56